ncbi:MAG: hypothetical protein EXS14_06055 [Planctomycetes bacterium]|nr:hypothetical protein [Planctomycetota bacterium]
MKIGLLAGFDEALVDALTVQLGNLPSVEVVNLRIGATGCTAAPALDVLLDRASHENAFFRAWVAQAEAHGVRVVNPPARTGPGAGFAELVKAARAGFRVVDSVLLPAKSYATHIGATALHNLDFPLNWDAILAGLGGSAVLLPAVALPGARGIPVDDVGMLLAAYDQTGTTPTLLQATQHGELVRAWCVRGHLPVLQKLDAETGMVPDMAPAAETCAGVLPVANRLLEILALDFAAIDFCCTLDGPVLLAVDAAAPEMDPDGMGPVFFDTVVRNLALRLAQTQSVATAAATQPKRATTRRPRGGTGARNAEQSA